MEKQRPDLSVIVPVYGVEKYIGRCVKSLMEQTHDNVEFIFVDDCTPDSSVEIAKRVVSEYPKREGFVTWIRQETNKGVTAARNKGLSIAKGKYIYYCDSDDSLHPEMLESLYNKANAEDLDFVWCDFYRETGNGTVREMTAEFHPDKEIMISNYLMYGWNVVWNTIVRKTVYDDNCIQGNEQLKFCEDFELMTKLLLNSKSWGKVEMHLYYYNCMNVYSTVRTSMNSVKFRNTVENGITAVTSIYDYIRDNNPGIFLNVKQVLHWNILNAKKFLCFEPRMRKRYLSIIPECHSDIDSNPLCSGWHKKMQHLILNPLTAPLAWIIGLCFKLKHSLR